MKDAIAIPLGRYGLHAYVSEEDEDLRSTNWQAHQDNRSGTYYACHRYSVAGERYRRWLHHEVMERILGRDLIDGEIVDHKDGNKLNNTRVNLRVATRSQNEMNKKKAAGRSQYKGVSFDTQRQKWRSYITVNKKRKHLGYFDQEWDAAQAYNEAALDNYGEFAILNTKEV